jgi:hypothetical protein
VNASREHAPISDPGTRLALEHLAESRQRLGAWTAQMATRMAAPRGGIDLGFGSFQPRSKTLRMLTSLVLPRLPWIRWGVALAPVLLRFWRRR